VWVGLSDGRVIRVPLAWFPRLLRAAPAEREAFTLSAFGTHWAALDEDVRSRGFSPGAGIGDGSGERRRDSASQVTAGPINEMDDLSPFL
jgi:hypothetical protein